MLVECSMQMCFFLKVCCIHGVHLYVCMCACVCVVEVCNPHSVTQCIDSQKPYREDPAKGEVSVPKTNVPIPTKGDISAISVLTNGGPSTQAHECDLRDVLMMHTAWKGPNGLLLLLFFFGGGEELSNKILYLPGQFMQGIRKWRKFLTVHCFPLLVSKQNIRAEFILLVSNR